MSSFKKNEIADFEILEKLSTARGSKDFENLTVAWFKTDAGKTYQIFMTDTLVQPRTRKPVSVRNIERFFKRSFLIKKVKGGVSYYMLREVNL